MLKVISFIFSVLIVVAFLFFCYVLFLKFSLIDEFSQEPSMSDLNPVVEAPLGQDAQRQKQDFSVQGEKSAPVQIDTNSSSDDFSLAGELTKQKLFAEQVSNDDLPPEELDAKEKKPLVYYLVLTEDKSPKDLSHLWDQLNAIGLSDKIKVVQTPEKKILVSYFPDRNSALITKDKIYRNTQYTFKIQKREISE